MLIPYILVRPFLYILENTQMDLEEEETGIEKEIT